MIEAQQKKKDHNDGIVMLMELTSHKKLALGISWCLCTFWHAEIFLGEPQPLKRQTKIAADGILILYFYLSKKIRLDFSSESSA